VAAGESLAGQDRSMPGGRDEKEVAIHKKRMVRKFLKSQPLTCRPKGTAEIREEELRMK